MARGSKIAFNRAAMAEVDLAVADGLFEVGKAFIETASGRAPDSPFEPYPTGEGLPKQGGVLAYVDGKKVAGWSGTGKQPKAPRAARVSRRMGVVVIAGFGFPARFNEVGTVKHAAQPFVTPSADEIITPSNSVAILAPIVSGKLGRRP